MLGKSIDDTENIDWNVQEELKLLIAMVGYKPVGVNRHFMMLMIHDKFSKALNKQISSQIIWKHLDTMYDMAALHESEIIPFPNENIEFELPKEFDSIAIERLGHPLPHNEKNSYPDPDFLKKRFSYSNKLKQQLFTPNPRKTRNSYITKSAAFNTPQTSTKMIKVVKSELNKENSETNVSKVKLEPVDPNKNIRSKRSSTPIVETKVKQEGSLTPQTTKNDSSSELSGKKLLKQESVPDSAKKKSKQENSELGERSQRHDSSETSVEKIVKQDSTSDIANKKTAKQDSTSESSSDKSSKLDNSSESSTKKTFKQTTISETLGKKPSKSDTPISKKTNKDSKPEISDSDKKSRDINPKKLRQSSSVDNSSNKRNSKGEKGLVKKKTEGNSNTEKKSSNKSEGTDQTKSKADSHMNSKRVSKSPRASAKIEETESTRKRKQTKKEEPSPARSSPAAKRKRYA